MAEKKSISPLILIPPVLATIIFGLFFFGLSGTSERNALPSTLIGKPAPALALQQLGEGAPFGDAEMRDGKVKLVNYWASWCAPCRQEHPVLEALAEKGVTIYGINYKDKPENALRFLAELGNPYAALAADGDGRTAIEWGVYGVPETYVVDGQGNILLRHPGPLSDTVVSEKIIPMLEAVATN